jgi:glycosyltransferase involved in cell wall biosynthesis
MLSMVELILVNNGFSPERELELIAMLENRIIFRIVNEPKPGLGFARRKGFELAHGEYFVLLDDDNTIHPEFVKNLVMVIKQFSDLGGVCPLVEPVWEVPVPEWLQDFGRFCLSYNASGKFRPLLETKYWPPHEATSCLRPPGGGMVIHRRVATHYLETVQDPNRIALARQPNSLVGCEDEDIFSGVFDLGLGVVFSETLKVYHHIPKVRTTARYLISLNYQMLYSYGTLHTMKNGSGSRSHFRNAFLELMRALKYQTACLLRGEKPVLRFVFEVARAIGFFMGCRRKMHPRLDTVIDGLIC